MNVFVTGATGFVGREIVRRLHEAGHSIRILARHRSSPSVQEAVSRWGAEVYVGNVLEAGSLGNALSGMEAVVHLVGIIAEVGDYTFERVHTDGTRNILTVAQQAGVRRFIHMSALGTRPTAAARYHQSKWAAEELVRRSGLLFTIFRPSLIYGPRDQFINLFARIAHLSPVVPLLGNPRARFQPVSVEAVAAAFVTSLDEPKSAGQTYDLCGPESLTLSEIVEQVLAVLHRKRFKLQVPLSLARCQAAAMEFMFRRLLRKPPPFSRDQLIMLQEDNVGDPQLANELLRLKHVPLGLGIASYLAVADPVRER
ncbi:MAG TPA: complex I NDUFA9 subunit family protein [Candidatus Paceibacterota bacterium]|nr:complex I NDUFA9 subunit family protein [Verrucomicrobiota bacterium]HSA11493.1 complex I NDUFA9 subunit family protein [Candidatus Paceibacterota bacterium]